MTLWEILTFARTPYCDVDNASVLQHVQKGGRLEKPEGCPDEMQVHFPSPLAANAYLHLEFILQCKQFSFKYFSAMT